ncbi:MAG: helix-turn-helix domain-containing protein [Acidihalobacter sp.]
MYPPLSHEYQSHEWENLLAENFLPGRVEVMGEGPAGHMASNPRCKRLWLARLSVRPQSITHTAPHLNTLSSEQRASVIAHVVIEGSGFVEQGGKRLPFSDGDISFRNLGEPSRVVFERPGSFFAVRLPATILNSHPTGGGRGIPTPPRIAPRATLSAETLRRLLSDGTISVTDFYVSNALPWLFAAAYHGEDAVQTEFRPGNLQRWQQVLEYIERYLFEADTLSPSACAQAIGISESYLHRLFAQRGLKFSRYILDQRLDAAHALLQSSAFRAHSIASIAYQCGFKDPAHFSRQFKQHFEMSPRDCRPKLGQ